MADKKANAKEVTKRRTAADIEARNKASVAALIAMYGPKGDGKKLNNKKK